MEDILISPKLIALKNKLILDASTILEQFWQEVTQSGTPLIEIIDDDDAGHVLVTFLWRAETEIDNIIVLNALAGYNFTDIKARQMFHLDNTDIWYRSYRIRNDVRTTYRFSINDSLEPWNEKSKASTMKQRMSQWMPDPLNPNTDGAISILELPTSPSQPWIHPTTLKAGQVESHTFCSRVLNNERQVWVYTPPEYTSRNQPLGLLLLFDDKYLEGIPVPTILDNLIIEGLIPPLVAVILDNPDAQTRQRELCAYPPFGESIVQELLPWLRKRYHISSDPKQNIVGGSSAGGLAAAFVGLKHADVFGNVLSQSGSFWWKPEDEIEYEWLSGQFASCERLPLRFYLDVGLLEYWYADPPTTLSANRHFRNVLIAKGYEVHYAEFNGGHDLICWRGTFADGLVALVGRS